MTTNARCTIFRHIQNVRVLMGYMVGELLQRHNDHDRSKLTQEEFPAYERHINSQSKAEYGSEEHAQAMLLVADALKFHYSRNRHHPEHFTNGVEGMTLIDLCEMLADWVDASHRYNANGSFSKSLEHNAKRFNLSGQLVTIFDNTARWLESLDDQESKEKELHAPEGKVHSTGRTPV